MKNNILKLSIAITILGISLWACKKEETPISTSPIEPSAMQINEYDYIGQKHNEGLEYVYNKLVELKQNKTGELTKEAVVNKCIEYTNQFYNTIKGDEDNDEDAYSLISNNINLPETYSNVSAYYNSNSNITANTKGYLMQLDNILSDENLSLSVIISQINQLEQNAYSNLSDEEKYVFYSATSTAKHTMTYWYNNIDNWKNLFDFNTEADNTWYGNAARWDVSGAAGGAAGAWVANTIPIVGQVAYGAAIIVTGVSCSVGSAVKSFLDWVWR